jgi:outer membrane protein assembly factor BamB
MQEKLVRRGRLILLAAVLCGGTAWAATIPSPSSGGALPPPKVQTRLSWRVTVPLRSVDAIKSCHLLEGYLYAISTESVVHCVRANTGQLLWSRQLTAPRATIYPPVAYRSPEFYAVAFTLSSEVVFLDPDTGSEIKRLRLVAPASASCTTGPGLVFSSETGSRIRTYDLKDGLVQWQIRGEAPIAVAPVYQPDLETVVFADDSGLLAMVWGTDKEEVYGHTLSGPIVGSIECDSKNFYVSTSDNFVNCVDRVKGTVLWQNRLPAKPQGRPVVCHGSFYQPVVGGGIQKISLTREQPDWFAPEAVQFLSEWDGQTALLMNDGHVALVDPATGKRVAALDAGQVATAASNAINEALLVVSPAGELRCFQPAGASPALLASFRPPTTQPTTQPAVDQASGRPLLARKEKPNSDNPLWARSSGGSQGTGQTSTGSSGRHERSSRADRGSGSSRGSRGNRSSRSDRGSGGSRGDRSSRGSRRGDSGGFGGGHSGGGRSRGGY